MGMEGCRNGRKWGWRDMEMKGHGNGGMEELKREAGTERNRDKGAQCDGDGGQGEFRDEGKKGCRNVGMEERRNLGIESGMWRWGDRGMEAAGD